jgi:hypothetical protein
MKDSKKEMHLKNKTELALPKGAFIDNVKIER